MHHSLRVYSRHRKFILKLYMFGAACTRIPLAGRLARKLANAYGRNMEGAYLLAPGEAEAIVDSAEGVAIGPCACRTVFGNCDNPVEAELILSPTRHIFIEAKPPDFREITKEEAREVLKQCRQRGLIQSVIKCRQDFYAICNCCACCCVPLRMSKKYGIGDALVRHADIVREFKALQTQCRD